jgi:glycosyltransferase involved in cell wall biosynthesis
MVAPFSVYPKGTVPVRMLPIARILIKRGHGVSIVVPPYDNLSESGREYAIENIKIHNVTFRDFPLVKYPLTLFSLCLKIFLLRPQCVYVFKPKGYSGLVAMLLIFFRRLGFLKNLLLLLDTDDWEGYGGFSDYFLARSAYSKSMLDFFDFQERWIPIYVDAITAASRALEKRLLEEGISRDKVFYVPNGAPQRNFNVDSSKVVDLRTQLGLENAPVILLYTRFFEYNVKKVIEIFKRVRNDLKNVKLLVLGKGDFGEEKVLQTLASEAGLQDSLIYAGWIRPEDIPVYLALGDVAIYPFDDTPLNRAKCPGKLVELMLACKAIVAENVGQISEYIIHGKSGVLAEPDDLDSFASWIVQLLRNEELRKKLGDNAWRRVTVSFNWETIVVEVEKALSSSASTIT